MNDADMGHWWVDVVDDKVRLRCEEVSLEEGVFTHEMLLPPDTAEHMAQGLNDAAKVARDSC